jgi:hypothetical protein
VPIFWKSGSLNLLEPSGPVRAVQELLYFYLYKANIHPLSTFIHSHMDRYTLLIHNSACCQQMEQTTSLILISLPTIPPTIIKDVNCLKTNEMIETEKPLF